MFAGGVENVSLKKFNIEIFLSPVHTYNWNTGAQWQSA